MLTYLIDGYNLLYQIRDLQRNDSEDLEDQRDRLIKRLVGFSAGRRFKFHLVFDSSRVRHGRVRFPGVRVDYASPDADTFIREVITRHQQNQDLVIVTSDRKDIGNYARVCGLNWMTSPQFWRKMTSLQPVSQALPSHPDSEESAPRGWTPDDDAWLRRVFEE